MINRKRIVTMITLGLVLVLFLSVLAPAGRACAKDNTVKVGYYYEFGMMEGAEDGAVKSGYVYEYIRELASIAGWKYDYVYGSFADLYQKLLDGEIDMLPYISWSEEREQLMLFPDDKMGDEQFYISSLKPERLSEDLTELEGKRIGTEAGAFHNGLFEKLVGEKGITCELIGYDGSDNVLSCLKNGEVDYAIETSTSAQPRELHSVYEFENIYPYYLVVTKDREDLLKKVNEAQKLLYSEHPGLEEELRGKYFRDIPLYKVLSEESREWLATHKEIRIGGYDNDEPYLTNGVIGAAKGIAPEQVDIMLEVLNIDIPVIWKTYHTKDELTGALYKGEIDCINPYYHNYSDAENDGLIISHSVYGASFSVCYKGRYNEDTLSVIATPTTRLGANYVRDNYPGAKVIPCQDGYECFERFEAGEATCVVLHTDALQKIMSQRGDNYKVRSLEADCDVCFAALPEDNGLIGIFNKAIPFLTDVMRAEIQNKYSVETEPIGILPYLKSNPEYIMGFVILILAIILLILIVKRRAERAYQNRIHEALEEAQTKYKELFVNYGQVMTLEEDFEALYDVELESGRYTTFINGEDYEKGTRGKLHGGEDYFAELRQNIDAVIYPEDRDVLYSVLTRNGIRKELDDESYFAYYYRIILEGLPVWYKIRIVYKDSDHNNVIIGVFNAQRDMMNRQKEANNLIENAIPSNNIVYIVNTADDTFRLLRMDDFIVGADRQFKFFSEAKAFFINEVLHPADKERLKHELDYGTIWKRLSTQKSYTVEYRGIIRGATVWHEMNVTSIGSDEVVIAFAEKNLELTKKHIEEKRFSEYLALFVVDLDTEMIQVLKTSEAFKTPEVGEAVLYEPAMREYAATFKGEAKEFFFELSDLNSVRREFATDDKRTFEYKASDSDSGAWVDVTSIVLERHDDGTPAMITLGFSIVDSLGTTRQEIQARLKENMQMIGGLASEYNALYYFDVVDEQFKVYYVDEDKFPEVVRMLAEGGTAMELFHRFGQSELIHPDDRYMFENLNSESVREMLAHRKKFSVRFRCSYAGQYLWTEMDVIKYGDVNEPASVIAVGFAERDAEIRSEQALANCFNVLSKDIEPYEAIDELLAITGDFYGAERCYIFEFTQRGETISNTYEWCADGIEPMIDNLQNVPSDEIDSWLAEFRRQGAFYMDTINENAYSTPEGRELLEMQGIDSLIAAPIMSGDEIVGFIGVDNPSKARDNIRILKNVSAIAFSEILKRKENDEEHITLNKLADTFLSVYYGDLSRDYIHNWKIAKEYESAYGSVEYYSVSMGGYVRENIAVRDRERCIRMTAPEFIRSQFLTKDRFSVDMTDIMLGYERNVVFDYVKVSEDGNQFVMCCRDVTENLKKEKERQRQLEIARNAAEASNRSKSTFLFNMSHDIRTPMNAIIGFSGMAKKSIGDEEKVKDYLEKIDTSGQQLLKLINQVLEMARIESGKLELEEKPVDIREEFNSMVTVLDEQAKANGQQFFYELKNVKHYFVLADQARMSSITLNIAGNAMKYTPEGGRIDFTLEEIKSRKEGYASFILTVADTGIGMSEEYLKVLFDPFTREKSSTVSRIQGTGLGMSIVKDLVELMGGSIDVQSEPGKGTRFTITIDFKQDDTEHDEHEEVHQHREVSFMGRRVLLVEDNELNREIAVSLLEEKEMLVEEAEDGTVAVELLKKNGPDYYDIILMDIQMPLMNGYEATKAIRAMYPHMRIPIIALSANAFSEDREDSIAAGMSDHVSKPIDVNELFTAMARYL